MSIQNKAFFTALSFIAGLGLGVGLLFAYGPFSASNPLQVACMVLAVGAYLVIGGTVVYGQIRAANTEADLVQALEATAYERSGWTTAAIMDLPPPSRAVTSVQVPSRRASSSQMMTAVSPKQLAAPVSTERPAVTEAEYEERPQVTAITVQRTYGRIGEGYPLLEPVRTGIIVSRKA